MGVEEGEVRNKGRGLVVEQGLKYNEKLVHENM
jgi:hypothetical protein